MTYRVVLWRYERAVSHFREETHHLTGAIDVEEVLRWCRREKNHEDFFELYALYDFAADPVAIKLCGQAPPSMSTGESVVTSG